MVYSCSIFILGMCRCSIWITNSGREEFRYLTPKELANKRVCELHFEEFMFSNYFKTNLKKNAVPNQFDKVTPEMFQSNDADDSNDEGESGIASESSSNHNNCDFVNALSNTDTVMKDKVGKHSIENIPYVVYGEETTSPNKCESVQNSNLAEFSLTQKQFPTIVSIVKDSSRSAINSHNDILRQKLTTNQNVRQ